MAGNGNSRQKKGSSFSLFGLFKSKNARTKKSHDDYSDFVKAYKVYPSDEDRGRWVAEPGIDRKASAYISSTTNKWENC